MEVIEVIEERLFANDDNDELELQYLGFQLFTSLKADLCQDIYGIFAISRFPKATFP